MRADADGIGNIYSTPGVVYVSATGSGIEYDIVTDCETCAADRVDILALISAKPKKYRSFSFRKERKRRDTSPVSVD